jgi:hypothetical protein
MHLAKTKIVWQQHQLEAVGKRSYAIRNDPMYLGTDVEAVRKAQREVLPAELHRPIRSMQEVPRLIHIWKKLQEQNYREEEGRRMTKPVEAISQHEPRVVRLKDETTANLMRELVSRLEDALDEDRIRRLVREEARRVVEARVPAVILQPETRNAVQT